MRFDPTQLDDDRYIEDRRGNGDSGSGGGLLGGTGRVGLGGMLLAAVAYFVFGINPSTTLSTVEAVNSMGGMNSSAPANTGSKGLRSQDELATRAKYVLNSTNQVWNQAFGGKYVAPTLVLYEGRTRTACGLGQAAAGPFYCPGDQKIYLDTSFFQEMERQMGAGGDFAQAYVIAHEVGHHIQYLTGTEAKISQMRTRVSETQGNQLSVRMELQADCYAGVWAAQASASSNKALVLEQGDIEEGINAAHKIGDDYLQKQAQGYVVPDGFTHGTSAQRMHWFKTGMQTGNPNSCNTFAQGAL